MFRFRFLPPANEVWGKVIFSEACVNNSVHTGGCAWLLGACMVAGGACMVAWGVHGCWGACVVTGGLHGCWGTCMVGRGACVVAGGMHGYQGVCGCWGASVVAKGDVHGCWGACMIAGGMHGCWGVWFQGACIGYDKIRSMSGRYASYWNAFLLFEKKIISYVSENRNTFSITFLLSNQI